MQATSPEVQALQRVERQLAALTAQVQSLAAHHEKQTDALAGIYAQLAVANLPGPGPDGTGKRLQPTLINIETLYTGVSVARWLPQQRLIGHTDSGGLDGADEAWRVGSRELLRVEPPEPLELPTGTLVVENADHLGGVIISESYTVSAGSRVGLDLFDDRLRWWLAEGALRVEFWPEPGDELREG
jgi:hypothetical protein